MSPETVVFGAIEQQLAKLERRPLIIGLCGAQGCGKSTLAQRIVEHFPRALTLSLDDLYLTRTERAHLAEVVHPLLATRGVPGTHDIPLGRRTLDALARGEATPLPRFEKSRDERAPRSAWPMAARDRQLIVFEGWCVGARPQDAGALAAPVNALEEREDTDVRWRAYVNAALAGPYQALFTRVDYLIMLAAPDWPTVVLWRQQQESAMRKAGVVGDGVMNAAGVERFVQHFERLTHHVLQTVPAYADLVLRLDADRSCVCVQTPKPPD